MARIDENTINFIGIEMDYTDFIMLIRAIEEAKAEVRELLKKEVTK